MKRVKRIITPDEEKIIREMLGAGATEIEIGRELHLGLDRLKKFLWENDLMTQHSALMKRRRNASGRPSGKDPLLEKLRQHHPKKP